MKTRRNTHRDASPARGAVAVAFVALALLPGATSAQVVEYYHLDAVGNVRAISNQAGQIVRHHDYLPFGEEWNAPPDPQPRRFTGKERDTETGLDYFGARYYSQKVGRFTTIDPVYNWNENLLDPQRWNRYAYARNNPLRFVDPDGRDIRLAPGLSKSNINFIRNALVEFVRRPSGQQVFEALANDSQTIMLDAGSLNDQAALTMAVQLKRSANVKFAETRPEPADQRVDVFFDPSVHRSQWTTPAGIDAGGVVTVGHEFAHVQDYLSRDMRRYGSGDLPTSATGPAMQRGKASYAEKPTTSRQTATAVVARELEEVK